MNDLAEPIDMQDNNRALSRKDFQTAQEVRWCPGCGDYAVLAQFQKMLAEVGATKENHVIVSGIGCASRFPYYVDCYGLHGIHGRAPAIATGVKAHNPRLTVWVVTGDGDALSIGAGHLVHALRRNVDIKILLFNNRIYGLTKGQYSPTSRPGQQTKSTPDGAADLPLEPLELALGAGASFVARSIDTDSRHLQQTLQAAYRHRGSVFVEILQNCPIFNDEAFAPELARDRLDLVDGAPLLFGSETQQGLALTDDLALGPVAADSPRVLKHNPANLTAAQLLARLDSENLPLPLGVFYAIRRATHDETLRQQAAALCSLQELLEAGSTWRVE